MRKWLAQGAEPAACIFNGSEDPTPFSTFSLLGQYEDLSSKFVRHAALLALRSELPDTVAVFHMGPPLVSSSADLTINPEARELSPDLAYDLRLTEEEETLVARWASKIANEAGPANELRYVIRPHVEKKLNERGVVMFHRFSCAGYAIEAFRAASIDLCDTENLPPISVELLRPAYPQIDTILKRPKLRKRFGVEDDPPWPVLMPAYLFHGADHRNQKRSGVYQVPHEPTEGYTTYPSVVQSS